MSRDQDKPKKDVHLNSQDPKTGTAASVNLRTWHREDLNNVNGMKFKHRPGD